MNASGSEQIIHESGFGSRRPKNIRILRIRIQNAADTTAFTINAGFEKRCLCLERFSLPDRNHVRTRLIIFFWSAPKRWRDAKFFPGKNQFQSRTSGHHRESGKSYSSSGCKNPFSLHLRSVAKGTVLEFLNNLWELGTE
jgi:hypothetical protein